MNRSNNNKAVKYASTIDGSSGDNDIDNRWHSHFEDLYNSVKDPYLNLYSVHVYQQMSVSVFTRLSYRFLILSLHVKNKNQKSGKATGPDDMAMEALTVCTFGYLV